MLTIQGARLLVTVKFCIEFALLLHYDDKLDKLAAVKMITTLRLDWMFSTCATAIILEEHLRHKYTLCFPEQEYYFCFQVTLCEPRGGDQTICVDQLLCQLLVLASNHIPWDVLNHYWHLINSFHEMFSCALVYPFHDTWAPTFKILPPAICLLCPCHTQDSARTARIAG